jgi:hypothetical protein
MVGAASAFSALDADGVYSQASEMFSKSSYYNLNKDEAKD